MKRKYKFFNILFLLICFILTSSNVFATSERIQCQAYYEAVRNTEDLRAKENFPLWGYKTFGFNVKETPSAKGKWEFYQDKDGYLTIGNIYSKETAKKINPEDKIIKIDGEELKDADVLFDAETSKDEATFELRNKDGELYEATLKTDFHTYTDIKHLITGFNITDIDIKKGTYDLTINQSFQFWYTKKNNRSDENHILHKLAEGTIIYRDEDGEMTYHICDPTKEDFIYSRLLDPSAVNFHNVIKADRDLETIKYKISPYSKHSTKDNIDALRVEALKSNVFKIKNSYNLKSFPFDRQKFVYSLSDDAYTYESRILLPRSLTYKTLDNFLKTDDIVGWNKVNYEVNHFLNQKITAMKDEYNSGIEIVLTLEREHSYYLFKVIFPIVLILMVCWSVVWVHPRELESRLTITIVCLLSLIAYNFVIDEELPKLEYLTVLDWIILASYVYAAIPNFLTIASFRYFKTNEALSAKLEDYGKKYGPTSYIAIVFIIIFLNANYDPHNSSATISWMTLTR